MHRLLSLQVAWLASLAACAQTAATSAGEPAVVAPLTAAQPPGQVPTGERHGATGVGRSTPSLVAVPLVVPRLLSSKEEAGTSNALSGGSIGGDSGKSGSEGGGGDGKHGGGNGGGGAPDDSNQPGGADREKLSGGRGKAGKPRESDGQGKDPSGNSNEDPYAEYADEAAVAADNAEQAEKAAETKAAATAEAPSPAPTAPSPAPTLLPTVRKETDAHVEGIDAPSNVSTMSVGGEAEEPRTPAPTVFPTPMNHFDESGSQDGAREPRSRTPTLHPTAGAPTVHPTSGDSEHDVVAPESGANASSPSLAPTMPPSDWVHLDASGLPAFQTTSSMPQLRPLPGNCDESCHNGCTACSSLCAGCPACDYRLPGPFGVAKWCNPDISAQEDKSSEDLVWTPAEMIPTTHGTLPGGVAFEMEGKCNLLCYEVWGSKVPDFSSFDAYTMSGQPRWAMKFRSSPEVKFFRVRAIERASSAVEVTHSKWSNVVELVSSTTTRSRTSTSTSTTSTTSFTTVSASSTTSTTSTSTTSTTSTRPWPTRYIPMWTPPMTAAPGESGQGPELEASLDFTVPTDEIEDYSSADVAAELRYSIAAMLDVERDMIQLTGISAAQQRLRDEVAMSRRLRDVSTGVLRVGYRLQCSSYEELHEYRAKLNNMDADREMRETFTDTLAGSPVGGRLTPVAPSSLSTHDIAIWHPREGGGGTIEDSAVGVASSSHLVWWSLALLILALCLLCALLCCLSPAWKSRNVKLIEHGAAPVGARGFRPGHFAEVQAAASEASMHATSHASSWDYSPVPTVGNDSFHHRQPLRGSSHYKIGLDDDSTGPSQGYAHASVRGRPARHGQFQSTARPHGQPRGAGMHSQAPSMHSNSGHSHSTQSLPAHPTHGHNTHQVVGGQSHSAQTLPANPVHHQGHAPASHSVVHVAESPHPHPTQVQSSMQHIHSMPALHGQTQGHAHVVQSMPAHAVHTAAFSSHAQVHSMPPSSHALQATPGHSMHSMPPPASGHIVHSVATAPHAQHTQPAQMQRVQSHSVSATQASSNAQLPRSQTHATQVP